MKNIKTYRDVLLEKGQEELDATLIYLVEMDMLELVKEALEAGANPNAVVDKNTPLFWAAKKLHDKIVEVLLDAGADPNIESSGTFPICEAANSILNLGKPETGMRIIEMLLDAGANANSKNASGKTCLAILAWNCIDEKDLFDRLFQHGADANIPDKGGNVPLYWVSIHPSERDRNIAKHLIMGGADPLLVFEDTQKILDFFRGDISWMPEGPLKSKLQRMQRGKSAFGM